MADGIGNAGNPQMPQTAQSETQKPAALYGLSLHSADHAWSQALLEMLSEPNGGGLSSSRVLSFLMSLTFIFMLIVHFFRTGQMPDGATMLEAGLGGGATYVANRLGTAISGAIKK